MSPLGDYPAESFFAESAALVITPDICFTVVRWKDDEGFSEIDSLTPAEIPILGAILLCVEKGQKPIYPYPTHQSILLRAPASKQLDADTGSEAAEWLSAYIKRNRLEYGTPDGINRPPIAGGFKYDFERSSDRNASRHQVLDYLNSADAVLTRGVASLLKANMAWRHYELREGACISLWVALDAAHSIILNKLRFSGNKNPDSRDAANFLYNAYGISGGPERFFEFDYENRIRFIHPDSRFGAEARPWLIADDFYELNENLIDLYYFFATDIPRDRQS